MEERRAKELRRSIAIRVGAAVGVAAALTCLAIVIAWSPFDSRTDVLGYPAFEAFNAGNYVVAYYLVVGFFPLTALALYLGLTRVGPRLGLAVEQPPGGIRPAAASRPSPSALEADPPFETSRGRAVAVARIGFVAALIGLEAGIALDSVSLGLLLCAPAYGLAVLLAAAAGRSWRPDWALPVRLAAVNSIGTSLAVAGLVAVSSITGVRVLEEGTTVHYPWFPAWLGIPAALAVAAGIGVLLNRATSPGRALQIERSTLLLVAAPVCLFVLTASLLIDAPSFYGDSPGGDLFHSGEQLVASRLVADGWFPWRDIVLTHGLLLDVVGPLAGQGVFGESRWGNAAGATMLLHPLYLVAFYFLCVYLFGRNWLFLLLTGVLAVGTWLGPEIANYAGGNFRFVLWPLVLLALAAALNRSSLLRSAGLALLVFGQAVLTPEAAPTALAVFAVLALYEWYWRRPGVRFSAAFSRTLCFAASGVALTGVFAVYLASQGALDDFLYVSATLVEGHVLKGGIPPATFLAPDGLFYFAALAPPASILIFFAFAVTRLHRRQELRTEDWVMAAVALSLLIYYPKFLARMDFVHLNQPYSLALPLVLYVVYLAVDAADRVIRARAPESLSVRITAHPASLVLVASVAGLAAHQLSTRVSDAAAAFRPAAQERPAVARAGYQSEFDLGTYRDLRRVIDAHLGPRDRLLDFTNEPALFHYLIDRDPSTRWFTAALTLTEELQDDQVRRLRRERPKLVVFDATSIAGLSNWDGIPTMVRDYRISSWILDHYRPLVATRSHTIYARKDLPTAAPESLDLGQTPSTDGVEFQSQRCDWGKAPSFLSGAVLPASDAGAAGARVRPIGTTQLHLVAPAGSSWDEFRWLELQAPADGFADAELVLSDRRHHQSPGREITFQTLSSSPLRFVVPVSSCPQWRGYRGPLYLSSDRPQDISAVRLIR